MLARIDRLADLGTAILTLSGGEPLLHPGAETMIAHARKRGMIASLITNGYLLTPGRIAALNRAGLDHLQISIDNVEPDAVSVKSLRVLEHRLRWLSERAEFVINVNSVVGGGIKKPSDALVVARRARELGFTSTVDLLNGHEAELTRWPEEMRVYRELRGKRDWAGWFNGRWQDRVAKGEALDWRCRAGARYLYVDEFGLVHYCSAQRGVPGIPLESYGRNEIRSAFDGRKACAPYCTINCVQQASALDHWRGPQRNEVRVVPLVVGPAPARQA
jgi:MoaA/NifB/PqqE/SkfB family radical SAM enzyme